MTLVEIFRTCKQLVKAIGCAGCLLMAVAVGAGTQVVGGGA